MAHVLIDGTGEFDRWWQNIEERRTLDTRSRQIAGIVGTQLDFRISHPRREGIAIRLVVWFPQYNTDLAVVVMGVDKAKMGDIFYDGVGNRADFLIREYLRDEEG